MRSELKAAIAVAIMFFANGMVCASWAARIPDVQRLLSLQADQLGLAMFACGAGALLSMPVAGKLCLKYGSRTITIVLLLLLALALVLAGKSSNFYELSVRLALLGFCASGMDIAMNAQGVAVLRLLNKPIMSRLHALWSVGGMSGAAAGALAAKLGVEPSQQVA